MTPGDIAGDASLHDSPVPGGAPGEPGRRAPSLVRNLFSTWTSLGMGVVYGLVVTPTVIHALQKEAYGIWSFLNVFVAYSNLLYLGLGAALMRYGAHYYAAGNRAALNRLVSVVLTIYTCLAVVSVVLGLLVAPSVTSLLVGTNLGSEAKAVSATVIVLAARVGLMFLGSVFSGVLASQGRWDLNNVVLICGQVLRLLAVPFAVRAGSPLLALALTVGVTGALEVVALAVMTFRLDRSLRVRFLVPMAAELRTLYGFGLFAFLLQVADRLISYTDTIVIGLTLGAGAVALYTLPLQLAEYGRLIVRGLVSVMLPHVTGLHATGQVAKLRHSYARTVKGTAFVAAFVTVSLVSLGPMFLRIWVGPSFAVQAAPLLICLGVAGFAQAVSVQSQITFCIALGRLRLPAAVLLVEAVANLGLSIALVRPLGIVGVAVATAIPAVLVSGLWLPGHVARQVGVPVLGLLRQTVLPVAGFVAALVAANVVLSVTIRAESYGVLLVKIALTGVTGAVALWGFASDSERRAFRAVLARARRFSRADSLR